MESNPNSSAGPPQKSPWPQQSHRAPVLCLHGIPDKLLLLLPLPQGDVEARLSAAAEQLLGAFEALLARLLQPLPSTAATNTASATAPQPGCSSPTAALPAAACPSPLSKSMASYLSASSPAARPVARQLFSSSSFGSSSSSGISMSTSRPGSPAGAAVDAQAAGQQQQPSLASLLVAFDDSWLEYLDQFVVWKGHDARGLEAELMRMAVWLERSMRLKLGRREPDSPEVMANPDLKVRPAAAAAAAAGAVLLGGDCCVCFEGLWAGLQCVRVAAGRSSQ